jgi:deoxyribose-phosphate aldolase
MCHTVTQAGADYIKTSTGFGTNGATMEDIQLFKKYIGENVKIKAAGGIKTLDDLEAFINEGCSRIGTSSAIKLIRGNKVKEY